MVGAMKAMAGSSPRMNRCPWFGMRAPAWVVPGPIVPTGACACLQRPCWRMIVGAMYAQ